MMVRVTDGTGANGVVAARNRVAGGACSAVPNMNVPERAGLGSSGFGPGRARDTGLPHGRRGAAWGPAGHIAAASSIATSNGSGFAPACSDGHVRNG